ncbi:hypothetical protein [Paenibacillus sp. FSL P4-0184]|uniref:hypothetical protein n=1 Tax=Paenibacillus sp. FSL P4-0184 TaxID=2921632 RepID=UPI0030FC844B
MKSIDDIRKNLAKRQKYLSIRVVVVALLVVFGLDGLYTTSSISDTVVLNTLMLFTLPLLLEYYLGMDSYSGYTNFFRWSGFFLHLTLFSVCIVGYMGTITLGYSNNELLASITLFGGLYIPVIFIKILSYLSMVITIFDFIFTFNSREMFYLNAQEDVEKSIETNYQKYKDEQSFEKRSQRFKSKILVDLEQQKG